MKTIKELTLEYWNPTNGDMTINDIGYLSGNDLAEFAEYIIKHSVINDVCDHKFDHPIYAQSGEYKYCLCSKCGIKQTE